MAIIEHNPECCGCAACVDICPKHALSMKEDEETFVYPTIEHSLCVDCGLCEKVCPLNFDSFLDSDNVKSYVGFHKSKDIIYESSSGGAFTAIADAYIKKGYRVYGASYSEHFQVVHSCAETLDECTKFKKSKYVQSKTEGCFYSVAEDLSKGKKVLFTGVSCQVAALVSYCKTKKIDTSNLVTLNISCIGVPSQKMFDTYISEEEKREKASISKFLFKNKKADKNKINSRTSYIEFNNGNKYIRTILNDPFLRGFYSRLFNRPSCSLCHFTRKERISDFTLSDAWGIEKLYPQYNPLEGCSLLMFNTSKAMEIFNELLEDMDLTEVPSQWALNSQRLFRAPTIMHKNRDLFFDRWKTHSFRTAVFSCTTLTFIHLTISKYVPDTLKKQIRSVLKKK